MPTPAQCEAQCKGAVAVDEVLDAFDGASGGKEVSEGGVLLGRQGQCGKQGPEGRHGGIERVE